MARSDTLSVRVNPEERKLIDQLAAREQRTPSNLVRWLLYQAAQDKSKEGQHAAPKPPAH